MTQALHRRLLDCAAGLSDDPVTFAQLARMHGPAMQGTLLVLVATPCVLPIPGIGNLLGLAMMASAGAMWRGGECSTLPERIATLELSARRARHVLKILARFYELAGRWSCQRFSHIAVVRRRSWLAGKLGLMGAVIFLPIPFGNILPALAIALLGLGLVFRDGLAVLASTAVAAAALAYTIALGVGAWVWWVTPLSAWLQHLMR